MRRLSFLDFGNRPHCFGERIIFCCREAGAIPDRIAGRIPWRLFVASADGVPCSYLYSELIPEAQILDASLYEPGVYPSIPVESVLSYSAPVLSLFSLATVEEYRRIGLATALIGHAIGLWREGRGVAGRAVGSVILDETGDSGMYRLLRKAFETRCLMPLVSYDSQLGSGALVELLDRRC